GEAWKAHAFLPIPSPWAAIGYRAANDVSWQMSYLLVPLVNPDARNFVLSTVGLDIDRISTNRSPWADFDLRWQCGLRIVGFGVNGVPIPLALGPHVGLRFERALRASGLSLHAWSDVGVLPSIMRGFPLVDLRDEVGLTWRPARFPGLCLSLGFF